MKLQEFSNEFDILYNNITSNQAPGLDEYEKSVFLTKAQEEIIKNYFNPKSNKVQEGYDDSIKRQMDFSYLMSTIIITDFSPAQFMQGKAYRVNINSKGIIPLWIIGEQVITQDNKVLQVIPVGYKEYTRLMSKPYKQPLKNQAWRLFVQGTSNSKMDAEIQIGHLKELKSYSIRCVRTPNPIILEDLGSELTIKGKNTATECELHVSLHSEILQRAVELAKIAYIGDVNSAMAAGQRSE